MKNAPCKGCTRRHTLCHADCEDYIQFTKAQRDLADAHRKWLEENSVNFRPKNRSKVQNHFDGK